MACGGWGWGDGGKVCTGKDTWNNKIYFFLMLIYFHRDWRLLNNYNMQQAIGVKWIKYKKNTLRELIESLLLLLLMKARVLRNSANLFCSFSLSGLLPPFTASGIDIYFLQAQFLPFMSSIFKIIRIREELVDLRQSSLYAFLIFHGFFFLLFWMSEVSSLTLLCLTCYSVNFVPICGFCRHALLRYYRSYK